jgi:hypothetical protein
MSTGFTRMDALKHSAGSLVLALALLLPVALHAADTTGAQSRQRSSSDGQTSKAKLDELDQVTIESERPDSPIAAWFRRMAGEYRATGALVYAGGSPLGVRGTTTCAIFGTGPGLQCTLNLQSADGMTHLAPGVFLFGFDLDRPQIRFMAVESTGSGEGSVGKLKGATATFRAECVLPDGQLCWRTTAITARPNSDQVRMEVTIEVRGVTAAHYEIDMTRLPGTGSDAKVGTTLRP